MAYDPTLAERVRRILARRRNVSERKMFGGLAFLIGGRMNCGILGDRLVVRVAPDQYRRMLSAPHVRPMDFTGRPLAGFLYVEPEGCKTDASLARRVRRSVEFVESLPPKDPRAGRTRRPKRPARRRGDRSAV